MSPGVLHCVKSPGVAVAGGKADGLCLLRSAGLDVPPFVVLPAEAYRAATRNGVPERLPEDIERSLDEAWAILATPGSALCVRSSATDEDGAARSYAGQLDTVLGVRSRAQLADAVLRCWRSLHGPRATAYRVATGAAHDRSAMAVVIQRLVDPVVSGVVFTVDPTTGAADRIVISAVLGLGEGLVSGLLDADTFVCDRTGRVVERRVVTKAEAVRPAASGTELRPVPAPRRSEPTLTDEQLSRLVRSAIEVESAAGHAVDIEFCLTEELSGASGGDSAPSSGPRFWFLQARPVTAVAGRAQARTGNRRVWDNANIVESYPGVTLPLTWSFIRAAYESVYRQFCELLGLREDEIRARQDVLANMLGRIRGRVYYDLLNWYRLCALLPGFRFNKSFMEGMMGLRTPEELADPPLSWREKWFVEFPRLLRTGVRAVRLQITLRGRVAEFHDAFERVYARHGSTDFGALSPAECMEVYAELERDVLARWKAPIVNDFSAMIFFGLLRKLSRDWGLDATGGIANAIVAGDGGIESARVTTVLVELAGSIARDADFAASFLGATPLDAQALLRSHTVHGPAFAAWIQAYGDRCPAELQLDSVPPRDDPLPVVELLRRLVRRGPAEAGPAGETLRAEAMRRAESALGLRPTRFLVPRRVVFRWVAERARTAIRNRENQRLVRTRAFGLVRRIFRSVGASLARESVIERADDVHYLEVEEIRAFVAGGVTVPALRELVRSRRAAVATWARQPDPPDHFVTWGPVHPDMSWTTEPRAEGVGALSGIGACPGVVVAESVVLHAPDPTAAVEGRVLVAERTDPGWVVLFPGIRGIAVARGSLLSHAAIVAREMGIPAVVGVRDVTRLVRTGDRVRLDGGAGTITVESRGDGTGAPPCAS